METPGSILKTEREKQKRSLEAIEKELNLTIDNLKAIEDDNYEVLPPEFFLKAYLRLYADILGLDPVYILQLYESRKSGTTVKEREQRHPPAESPSTPLKIISSPWDMRKTVAAIIITALIALCAAVVMHYKKPAPPAEIKSAIPSPEAVTEPQKLSLTVTATKITWVSVRTDGSKPREWLLRPGEQIDLSADEKFELKIGNAGGTRLTLNGRDMGMLGPNGKVIDIVLP